MAGNTPIFPVTARRIANIARLGIVWSIPVAPNKGPRSRATREAKIPKDTPKIIAAPVETPVSIRCSPVRSQSSGSRSNTKSITTPAAIRASP